MRAPRPPRVVRRRLAVHLPARLDHPRAMLSSTMISASVRRRFASGAPRFASSSSSSTTTEQATQKAQQAAQQAGAKAQQALAGAQKTVGNLLGCEYRLLRSLTLQHRAALLPVTRERLATVPRPPRRVLGTRGSLGGRSVLCWPEVVLTRYSRPDYQPTRSRSSTTCVLREPPRGGHLQLLY